MRMRSLLMAGLLLALSGAGLVACGGGGGGEAEDGIGTADVLLDVAGADITILPNGLEPPTLTLRPFTVVVETTATSAMVGQDVVVASRVARGAVEGDVTLVWDLDGATSSSAAGNAEQSITFGEPGRYAVSVQATDTAGNTAMAGVVVSVYEASQTFLVGDVDGDGAVASADLGAAQGELSGEAPLESRQAYRRADVTLDGRVGADDIALIAQAVDAGADAPTALWPGAGSLGTKVRLIHPALLDVGAEFQVQFGQAVAMTPVRGLPGYATFVVPPDFTTAQDTTVVLLKDGTVMEGFEFEILPLPAASSDPGARVLETMDLLQEQLDQLAPMLMVYFDALGVPEAEQAPIMGMLEVAVSSYSMHREAFVDAFARMEPEGRAAFEQIALANGLEAALGELQEVKTRLAEPDFFPGDNQFMSVGTANFVMGVVCTAQQIADISGKVAEINEIASGYLDWFDWWPATSLPIVGQVITFLSSVSTAIGAITDIISAVQPFIPTFGDIRVNVTPASVMVGATVACSAELQLMLGANLCAAGSEILIENLVDAMTDQLSRRLGSMIPLASSAFEAVHYDRDEMGTILGLVYDAVGAIAGEIMDLLGVQEGLESLAADICEALGGNPWLPLSDDTLSASCGNLAGGSWTCTEDCIGSRSIDAERGVCGQQKTGSSAVTCEGCNGDNCQGCCSAQGCVPTASQDVTQCGAGGATCAPCAEYHQCNAGVCECTDTCDTVGEKECQGNAVYLCVEVVANPSCKKWQLDETCINGAVCESGVCEGGCHAGNCDGCCTSIGDCLAGTSNDSCGKDGETCLYCGGPPWACVDSQCVCEPDCAGKQCGPDSCDGSCGECANGETCDADGQCQKLCGNGVIDDGEACESDEGCTGENEVCQNCQCQEPGGGGPCDPPDQGWGEGFVQQAHITVNEQDCACGTGKDYNPDSVVTLDYWADDGAFEGSLDGPWTIIASAPGEYFKDMGGWTALTGLPANISVTLTLKHNETGQEIQVTFTLSPEGISNVSISC